MVNDLSEILKGCSDGDRNSQARLYALLSPKLLGVAMRYLGDRDDAEDVMQDSFVKIFTNLASFKGEGSFEGWARRITANTALNALKKKKGIFFERNLTIVEEIEFEEEHEAQIQIADVLACMDKLPSGYRSIINMVLFEEFSHKEVAEKLNIQESTSRSQYARARQALLKTLKEKLKYIGAKNA